MTWGRILLSRFFIVPVLLLAGIGGWNVYVDLHAHGLLEGDVVDSAGRPISGAIVILSVHDFVTQVERARTQTDVTGRFRFSDNNSHLIQLEAQTGSAASPRVTVRLWFRGQDRVLTEPLRVPTGA
jgi:hypothetical protein